MCDSEKEKREKEGGKRRGIAGFQSEDDDTAKDQSVNCVRVRALECSDLSAHPAMESQIQKKIWLCRGWLQSCGCVCARSCVCVEYCPAGDNPKLQYLSLNPP